MVDTEVQVEVQLASNSPTDAPVGPPEDVSDKKDSDCMESLQDTVQEDVEELRSLLAGVALAPPSGDQAARSCGCESCSCLEVRLVEESLQTMELQLLFLMSKADDLQDCLVNGQGHLDKEALAAAVTSFLYTCQPYFNLVESTARSTKFQITPLTPDISLRLFDFSEQLCDALKQLVLTYASHDLLCLDETEPHSVSHFFIGQSQLGSLRLSVFLYCKPTPYLAGVDTGLYKCMRWNVDRLSDGQQQTDQERGGEVEERKAGTVGDTEYYFLCYEDIPNPDAEAGGNNDDVFHDVVRMWSIGQWVQEIPNPDEEDIYDWIMCDVPRGSYQRLLLLGSDEPSSCSATDFLQQLLQLRPTAE